MQDARLTGELARSGLAGRLVSWILHPVSDETGRNPHYPNDAPSCSIGRDPLSFP